MRRSPFQKAFFFSRCGKGRTVLVGLGNNGVKVGCRGARLEEPLGSDCEMSSSLSPDRYPRLHPLRAFCLPPTDGCGAQACLASRPWSHRPLGEEEGKRGRRGSGRRTAVVQA